MSLVVAPGMVNLRNGGSGQTLTVASTSANGSGGPVSVAISGLPMGVTATPSNLSLTPGQIQQVTLTASGAAVGASTSITLTGTSGSITQTATAAVTIASGLTTASLSNSSFDFGGNLVGSTLTKPVVTVQNIGTSALSLNPTLSGDASYTLVPAQSCGQSLAAGASCTITVSYAPTIASASAAQTSTLSLGLGNVPSSTPQTVSLTSTSAELAAGSVTATANPQVAQYTLTLPYPGSWSVSFGPTTSYGRATSVQAVGTAGMTSSLYVAGMLPNATYHMRAAVTLANGVTITDADHTFTTGALPAGIPNTLPVTTTAGLVPQPGIELVDTLIGAIPTTALATDLQGNVIWTYPFPDRTPPALLYPVSMLPNGHFLCMIAPAYPILPGNLLNVIREFDLAGNTVQQISMADLNTRLAGHGFSIALSAFSHDIVVLPNGHYLVIATMIKPYTDLPGYPGVTQVAGDVVVDLNSTMQPVWVWNPFDHLDVNRHPYQFPDWTHANSVAYSKDDGNFIISLRHQNWVLKIDYQNGAGTGNVIWHLGEGGDFTLKGGTDPTDWFYAQHDAKFSSSNTSGLFSLTLFDNGDDRMFPDGVICGSGPGQTPCLYSTVVQMQVDEGTKTATFQFHQILPAKLYSYFAGSTDILPNGNFEYNLAGVGTSAYVFEVIPGATLGDTPQTVWQMSLPGTNTYRAARLPSLYPGVQW